MEKYLFHEPSYIDTRHGEVYKFISTSDEIGTVYVWDGLILNRTPSDESDTDYFNKMIAQIKEDEPEYDLPPVDLFHIQLSVKDSSHADSEYVKKVLSDLFNLSDEEEADAISCLSDNGSVTFEELYTIELIQTFGYFIENGNSQSDTKVYLNYLPYSKLANEFAIFYEYIDEHHDDVE